MLFLSVLLASCGGNLATRDTNLNLTENYLDRAVTMAGDDVLVTASVLALDEIGQIFGARIDEVGVQPVFLKIENLGAHGYLLFLRSVDPEYFSPYEAARRAGAHVSDLSIAELYPKFRDAEIPRFIPPGGTVQGFVYTHLDEGFKAFNVELLSNRRHQIFHAAVAVPGLATDYADFNSDLVDDENDPDLTAEELRTWLREDVPCCASAASGAPGDPVNIAFVGDLPTLRSAMVGGGWDVTAEVDGASLRRMISAFIFGSRFRYAPVSPLFLFGREQDMAFQKARAIIDERNHVRLWLAPVRHDGLPVWVGHVSRDAGIKLSGRLWPPTTHVIDPAVDEARFLVMQDIASTGLVSRFGMVAASDPVPFDRPSYNAEDDPYFTDGLRMVFFLDPKPRLLEEIELLEWALPPELEPFRDDGLFVQAN